MKIIELTRGKQTIVDDEDYEFLSQWRWIAAFNNRSGPYAVRHEGRKMVFMHRVLLGVPAGVETDHKNRNGLDNRRLNLRPCTRTQNQQNRKTANGKSKFKGVIWEKGTGKWRAQIRVNKKKISRMFKDEEAAARCYDQLASLHFGEFAVLNFAS